MNKIGVFYGSTTGTTEDLARRIAEKLDVPSAHVFDVNPEKPDVPLNKNDAFQKVQKRRVQEKR